MGERTSTNGNLVAERSIKAQNIYMNQAILQLCMPFLLAAIGLFVLAGLIWLFFNHGIDKIRHPEEWKDQGSSGERIIYRTLVDQFHVPENQILRNVIFRLPMAGHLKSTCWSYQRRVCWSLSVRIMLEISTVTPVVRNGFSILERGKASSITHLCRIAHAQNISKNIWNNTAISL